MVCAKQMVMTCEGLVGCQVAAVQQVQVAREGQVFAEAASVDMTTISYSNCGVVALPSTACGNETACVGNNLHVQVRCRW